MPKMTYFPVKNFRGVESKIDARDAGKGGMIRLEGAMIYPWWAIMSGPTWINAFSTANMGAAIDAAMAAAGLSDTEVHFATVTTEADNVFLVAWDRISQTCVGFWHVDQLTQVPTWGEAPTIVVNTSSAWNGYTQSLNWFHVWVGTKLWLGNGTDTNLVFDIVAGTLTVLGPATAPNDPQDPSQGRIPPAAAWARNTNGEVFAASCNPAAFPLRVYITEPPNKDYPYPTGLKDPIVSNVTTSSVDIIAADGACITALQDTELGIVVHLNIGPPVLLDNVDGVDDGWRANQRPMKKAHFCAINQLCASNDASNPFYLGWDYELYRKDGDELATAKSTSYWNRAALREVPPASSRLPQVLFDRRSNRAWIGMPTIEDSTMGWWVWDVQNNAISGPIRYPSLNRSTMMRIDGAQYSWAVGMTTAGALLVANLNLIDEPVLPVPGTPLDVPYRLVTAAPTPNLSIPYVGINKCGTGWTQTKDGLTLHFPSPWSDVWVNPANSPPANQLVTPTSWLNNAYLAVIELLEEDFGTPVMRKNIMELREQWRRNQLAYLGAFIEVDGTRDGRWMGCAWTNLEQLCHVNLTGTRMRLRLIIAFFNAQQAMLPDLTVGYFPVAPR